jgi:hypothetical protein
MERSEATLGPSRQIPAVRNSTDFTATCYLARSGSGTLTPLINSHEPAEISKMIIGIQPNPRDRAR